MKREYGFIVDGPPVPKGRPRFFRGRVYTPSDTEAFEKKVALLARVAGVPKLPGGVAIELRFFLPNERRKDFDNLAKAITDALNGVAYEDDSQICEAHIFRAVDAERPRTLVMLKDLSAQATLLEETPDSSPSSAPKPLTPTPSFVPAKGRRRSPT